MPAKSTKKKYRVRLEEAITDIRQRIGETGKLDTLAAFMAAVPPSKSLIRHRDDILTLAGNGYVTIQVVAYLKEVKNLDVCDRTVRKLVNDEYTMSLGAGQDPGRLDFAAKARFALDRYPAKSVSGTATRILGLDSRRPASEQSRPLARSSAAISSSVVVPLVASEPTEAQSILRATISELDRAEQNPPPRKRLLAKKDEAVQQR